MTRMEWINVWMWLESMIDIEIGETTFHKIAVFVLVSIGVAFITRKWDRRSVTGNENTESLGVTKCDEIPETAPVMKRLYYDNLEKYQEAFELLHADNHTYIHEGKVQYYLKKSKERSLSGEPLVDQEICWTLEGSYVGEETPLRFYRMLMTISAFTSWKDGSVTVEGSLNKRGGSWDLDVRELVEPTGCTDVRELGFFFPKGVECVRGEAFTLKIRLHWNRGTHFKALERYYSDPENYGKVEKLTIEVVTDIDEMFRRDIRLYKENKNTSDSKLIPITCRRNALKMVSWNLEPQEHEMYVIEIKKIA